MKKLTTKEMRMFGFGRRRQGTNQHRGAKGGDEAFPTSHDIAKHGLGKARSVPGLGAGLWGTFDGVETQEVSGPIDTECSSVK